MAKMDNCKSSLTPTAVKVSFTPSPMTATYFQIQSLVGALQYVTITRPKITIAVNSTYQAMHKPTISDFTMVKRIICYLKGTSSFGLHLQSSPLTVHVISNSEWATDHIDKRSITGNCIFLGTKLILWNVKKQRYVAKSSKRWNTKLWLTLPLI